MTSAQMRIIGVALAALVLIVMSVFVMDWFVAKASSGYLGVDKIGVDLRTVHACVQGGACGTVPVSRGGGAYPSFATLTFWSAIAFGLAVAGTVVQHVVRGDANRGFAKLGFGLGAIVLVNGLAAGYLFNPGLGSQDIGAMSISVHRTAAPLLLALGCIAGAVAMYWCAMPRSAFDGVGEYKPLPVARVVAAPAPVVAAAPVEHPKLAFAVAAAELSAAGIDARRENGEPKLVAWPAVVGVVARRLPPELGAHDFVDIVSTAGSTLRFAPWTKVTGELRDAECRALVQLVTAHCPGAHLDRATRAFLDEGAEPAQLPDAATLAAHDERLA